jgi:hypothetical protein
MPASKSTDAAIESFANAVFNKHSVEVLEAYSNYGVVPRAFGSASQLAQYLKESLSTTKGMAHFFVVYSDMNVHPISKKIQLKPNAVPGQTYRYTWEDWGLISVIFKHGDQQKRSYSVSANSRKRAEKWRSTYPDWPLPDTWNWPAVERHTRRLRRAMKASKVAERVDPIGSGPGSCRSYRSARGRDPSMGAGKLAEGNTTVRTIATTWCSNVTYKWSLAPIRWLERPRDAALRGFPQ